MIRAKRSLSQNFLVDKNISKKIFDKNIVKNKTILEIGPGYGFLTDSILLKKPKKIILVEKDTNLKEKLYEKYKDNKKVEIIGSDILSLKLNKFKDLIIISNLPYNISTKVILYLFHFNEILLKMIL